jgi:hypothetical protein
MARDPRTIPPSEVHAHRCARITSRSAYVNQLVARSSALAAPLAGLPDVAIGLEKGDAYHAVNSPRLTDAVARVLTRFAQRADVDPNLPRTFTTDITMDGTALGCAAQLQGYDWLLRQGVFFDINLTRLSQDFAALLNGDLSNGCRALRSPSVDRATTCQMTSNNMFFGSSVR